MKTRIVTNAEIKKLAGLGSASDALVDIWNDAATEMLCEILNVAEIAKHAVVDERVKIMDLYSLLLNEFPVDTTQTITLKTTFDSTEVTGYTFKKDPGYRRTLRSYGADGKIPYAIPYDELFVSYTAGYGIQDTLKVLSITGLDGKTLKVKIAGVETVYTLKTTLSTPAVATEIQIGADAAGTASNISAKLSGTVSTDTVTLPLGTNVSLGTASISQFTIINADLPPVFKSVIAFIVAGGIAEKNKAGSVVSYTIGGKSVSFRSNEEASATEIAIRNWLPHFKKVNISSI